MFRDIIGHERQMAWLQEDLQRANVSHAYLFAGPRHVGKFTVAKWFAWRVLSARGGDRQETERLLGLNIHPDVLVLDRLYVDGECTDWGVIAASSNVPQEHRAHPPKARTDTIHIEDIRAIQKLLFETSLSGVKILLLRSLERLQEEAGNAFLKILEEPPPSVMFLCTTQCLGAVSPTVRSRMRTHLFSTLPPEKLSQLLMGLPVQDRSFILQYAQGAAGQLIRCMQDKEHLQKQRRLSLLSEQLLSSTSASRAYELLLSLSGDDEEEFFTHLLLTLRRKMQGEMEREICLQLLRAVLKVLHCARSNVQRDLLFQYIALAFANNRQLTTYN